MDFKLVSKNNLGAVTALLLVILLSQSKFFNFLLDTSLGRAILILFILVISYTNKILGVVSVLFIIIMFNNSDIGYMEGFTSPSNIDSTTENTTDSTTENTTDSTVNNDTTTKPTLTDEQKKQLLTHLQEKAKDKDTSTITSSSSVASEGFDIIGAENAIKRGKQSNSIPVNTFTHDSDNVEPFASFGGNFSDSFASF